jgi:hypothetical protein
MICVHTTTSRHPDTIQTSRETEKEKAENRRKREAESKKKTNGGTSYIVTKLGVVRPDLYNMCCEVR